MTPFTVDGIYEDGKIQLLETPAGIPHGARVRVTLADPNVPIVESGLAGNAEREALRQRAFARMKTGLHLGGPPYPKRDELYDRFDR